MPRSQRSRVSARQACSRLLLFWSALAYGWEVTTTTTSVRTVEYDFGAPAAPAAYQPLGVTPMPQDKQVGLAVGIGTAAAAAAGGVGMAIYAAHEANKPEVITRIVTPAPKVVYVPAQVEVDVLANGQRVGTPFVAAPPPPLRLYEVGELARRPTDFLSKAPMKRRDMVILIFAIALVCCACLSCGVVYGLFCAGKKKKSKRAVGSSTNKLMMPAATAPKRRRDSGKYIAMEQEEGVHRTLEFRPQRPLGVTIDNATGEILEVKDGGQAAAQAVQIGDKIVLLNGFNYSQDLLAQYDEGDSSYDITLLSIEEADFNQSFEDVEQNVAGTQRDLFLPPAYNADLMQNSLLPPVPPYQAYANPYPYGMNMPMSMPMSMPRNYVTPSSFNTPAGRVM